MQAHRGYYSHVAPTFVEQLENDIGFYIRRERLCGQQHNAPKTLQQTECQKNDSTNQTTSTSAATKNHSC